MRIAAELSRVYEEIHLIRTDLTASLGHENRSLVTVVTSAMRSVSRRAILMVHQRRFGWDLLRREGGPVGGSVRHCRR
jgi:hypothetical protein